MRSSKSWQMVRQLLLLDVKLAILACFTSVTNWGLLLVYGLLVRMFFDTMLGKGEWHLSLYPLIALFAITELLRTGASVAGSWTNTTILNACSNQMRTNLLARLIELPCSRAVLGSPGETVSRLEDDVNECARFAVSLIGLSGVAGFALASLYLMMRTSVQLTLLVVLPIGCLLVAGHWIRSQFPYYQVRRRMTREASARVSGSIGEMFAMVQEIKIAGAEESIIEHLRTLNELRRKASLRETLVQQVALSMLTHSFNFGMGILLLAARTVMRSHAFTIGDLAFYSYLMGTFASMAATVAAVFVSYRKIQVSLERLLELTQGSPPADLTAPDTRIAALPVDVTVIDQHLDRIDVTGLCYSYPESATGIYDINLCLRRGSLTVVTGAVGSGKTTLLHTILGLLPKSAGEIFWNGRLVEDPGAFFVPPRSAFTPQNPMLFSQTLRENILCGLEDDDVDLFRAVWLAVLDGDVKSMENGLDTMIGARGLRLSGGQLQRAAAARTFVRRPELIVMDDVSNALDFETEKTLWERLRSQSGVTRLVVSQSPIALRHADHIVVLKQGRLLAEGKLDELLDGVEDLRQFWEDAARVRPHSRTE